MTRGSRKKTEGSTGLYMSERLQLKMLQEIEQGLHVSNNAENDEDVPTSPSAKRKTTRASSRASKSNTKQATTAEELIEDDECSNMKNSNASVKGKRVPTSSKSDSDDRTKNKNAHLSDSDEDEDKETKKKVSRRGRPPKKNIISKVLISENQVSEVNALPAPSGIETATQSEQKGSVVGEERNVKEELSIEALHNADGSRAMESEEMISGDGPKKDAEPLERSSPPTTQVSETVSSTPIVPSTVVPIDSMREISTSVGAAKGVTAHNSSMHLPTIPEVNPFDKYEAWMNRLEESIDSNKILSYVKYGGFIDVDSSFAFLTKSLPSSTSSSGVLDTNGSFFVSINHECQSIVQAVANQQYKDLISKSQEVNNQRINEQLISVYDVFPEELEDSSPPLSSTLTNNSPKNTLLESWIQSLNLNDRNLSSCEPIVSQTNYRPSLHFYETAEEKTRVDLKISEALHWWGLRPEPLLLSEIVQKCPKRPPPPPPPPPRFSRPPLPSGKSSGAPDYTASNSRTISGYSQSHQNQNRNYHSTNDRESFSNGDARVHKRKRSRSRSRSNSQSRNDRDRSAKANRRRSSPPRNSESMVPKTIEEAFGSLQYLARSKDGSKFIQSAIEQSDPSTRGRILQELYPNLFAVMTDSFGNYVIQKLFEHIRPDEFVGILPIIQNRFLELAEHRVGHFLLVTFLRRILPKLMSESSVKGPIDLFLKDVVKQLVDTANRSRLPQLCQHPYGSRIVEQVFRVFPETVTSELFFTFATCVPDIVTNEFGGKLVETAVSLNKEKVVDELLRLPASRLHDLILKSSSNNALMTIFELKRHGSTLCWKLINSFFRDDPSSLTTQLSVDPTLAMKIYSKLIEHAETGQLRIMEQFTDRFSEKIKTVTVGSKLVRMLTESLDKRESADRPRDWSREEDQRVPNREVSNTRTRSRSRSPQVHQSNSYSPRRNRRNESEEGRDRSRNYRGEGVRSRNSQRSQERDRDFRRSPETRRRRSRSRSYSPSRSRDRRDHSRPQSTYDNRHFDRRPSDSNRNYQRR